MIDTHTPRDRRREAAQLAARLSAKTEPELNSGCLLWTGANDRGYGTIYIGKKRRRAHRLSYELANGPVPYGLHVLHRCDVPACINPAHLFVGTQADNMADMKAKGRSSKNYGERANKAKLTEAEVHQIVEMIDAGHRHRVISLAFGVSKSAITNIGSGATWAAVTGRGASLAKQEPSYA